MPWVPAAITAGGAIIGGMESKSGANSQADAALEAARLQKEMFDTTQANVKPWLDAGKSSLADLSQGMASGKFDPSTYISSGALNGVGPAYLQAGLAPGTLESGKFNMNGVSAATPLSQFGSVGQMSQVGGQPNLQNTPGYVSQATPQGKGDFTVDQFHQDPGYQFQLQQGLDALTNKSSLAGGMNSNNMKGLIGYAEGMANTDYQNAFQNYQTDANRTFGQQQTGLQDYIQQFMVDQNTTGFNNNVNQSRFNNQLAGAGFNNNVTQQQYQDQMGTTGANNAATQQMNQNNIQTAGFNNQVTADNFKNLMSGLSFNNQNMQNNLNNYMANSAYNNSVTQQQFQNQNLVTGLNNQNAQQEYSNLATLSGMGMGAGLGQGQISAQVGQNIGNNMVGAGNALAAGKVGVANAVAGGLGQGYNSWLQNQYMNQYSGGMGYYNGAPGSGAVEGAANFMGPMQG